MATLWLSMPPPIATARTGNVQFCLVKSMWTGPVGARREAYLPKMELRSWTFSWESFTAAFIAPKARSPRLSWIFFSRIRIELIWIFT